MTFREAIRYLESFTNYEEIPVYPYKESLGLERIRGFLEIIGNPQESLQCIHVAGTKGKGSTCAFIAYILRAAGFKVGLYTSPHLSDFRERIRILRHKDSAKRSEASPKGTKTQGQCEAQRSLPEGDQDTKANADFEGMITRRELVMLVERLRPAIDRYNKASLYGPLTFFEAHTAFAFVYFKEKKVDFAVLETGLGGRLDATNVVNPLVCAITPISLEHTDKLGNTFAKIAAEKAGIIKGRKLIVVSAPQEEEAGIVIKKRCKEQGSLLREVGKDIIYEKLNNGFRVRGAVADYPKLKLRLIGEHQLMNASVAIGAVEALKNCGIQISAQAIRAGLGGTVWPGRCEIVARRPLIILDGAQNMASAGVLQETIKKNFSVTGQYKKLILVLGISSDKDIEGICGQLCNMADKIILTQANSLRAAKVSDIARIILLQGISHKPQVMRTRNVKEAIKKALDIAGARDLILVTGSLFVVGEARNICVI